ncbi:hypothetical protein JK182_01600 [Acetobacter okinawensis]|uniref:hypothetical protein n=1 Tax=Acetobacter okinawensis TaxID=1076594 RepID=UPI001BAB44C8|nr:hypothetical protein [Acetobacter okinawensis]MBS0987387.1 hypothetical protein [Acetobacter okinawensis]
MLIQDMNRQDFGAPDSQVSASEQIMRDYLNDLDRMDEPSEQHIRLTAWMAARLNIDATQHGLRPSARILLSGLLDMAVVTGSLCVYLTTFQCQTLLGLGSTAVSEARASLVQSGFVEKVGQGFDLRPWALRIAAERPKNGYFSNSILVSFNNNKNYTKHTDSGRKPKNGDVPYQAEHRQIVPSDTCPKATAKLLETREALGLSSRLTSALLKRGVDVSTVGLDMLLLAIGSVIGDFLPRHHGSRALWDRAVQKHGHIAVLGLVAAIEDTTVRSTEGWFAAFVNRFGGFAAFEDLTPNLERIRRERQKEVSEAAKVAENVAHTVKQQQKAAVLETFRAQARKAFDVVLDGADDLLVMQCELGIRVWAGDDGTVGLCLFNQYQNRHAQQIKTVAANMAKLLSLDENNIINGNVRTAVTVV